MPSAQLRVFELEAALPGLRALQLKPSDNIVGIFRSLTVRHEKLTKCGMGAFELSQRGRLSYQEGFMIMIMIMIKQVYEGYWNRFTILRA
jgi:hypothetical protein